jgi:23S rRNA (adenine2503-C2)-methyltransferase
LKLIATSGDPEIALVYIVGLDSGRVVECVESRQPPLPRSEKWVLLVSTMAGCPIGCEMCDAGGDYGGLLTREEILAQIDFMVRRRYPDGRVPARKFKIQFARMGEPALNPAVLEVLEALPADLDAPGLMASVSTIAPRGSESFFEQIRDIKSRLYAGGRFQLQFSIHTTDPALRDRLVPVGKWSLEKIGAYGERFRSEGDRKVTLNFALAAGMPVDAGVLLRSFSPEHFLIKITPLNPTYSALARSLRTYIDPHAPPEGYPVVEELRRVGYEVLVSIGEAEENRIGSNCGQYLEAHLRAGRRMDEGYTYPVTEAAGP